MRSWRRGGVVACVLLVGGCTGGDDGASSSTLPSTTVATTLVDPFVAESSLDLGASYLEGLSTATAASSTAVADSDAAHYLDYRRALAEVFGWAPDTSTSTPSPSSSVPAGATAVCDPSGCVTVTDIELDPASGQVTTFSIDGAPLQGRIAGGGDVVASDGVSGRVRSVYRTNDGRVLVAVALANASDVDVDVFGFAAVLHAGPETPGVEAAGSWGADRLGTGDSGNLVLSFDDGGLTGRVDLPALRDDGVAVLLALPLPAISRTPAPTTP